MKKIRFFTCLFLIFATLCTLCSCGEGGDSSNPKTETELVRDAVESKALFAYYGSTIGDNELKSSKATITNVSKISTSKYRVSGKIVMTDIYGTEWNNTFDCEVTSSSTGKWSAGSLEYTSKNWTKS